MEDLLYRIYMTFVYESRWKFFADGLMMTLILTIGSFLMGSIVGALFCAIRMRLGKIGTKIYGIINGFLVQIPTLVLLMIFTYVVFADLGISTVNICIIGLTLKNAAYLADIFYSAISSVNPGEIEAARALGMNKTQAFLKITLPQATDNAMAIYQNQFVTCLQETSIVGSLAVEELTKASNIVTSRTLDALFSLICVSIIYILVGVAGTWVLGLVNKKKHLGGTIND